jgi:hypothetical protein
MVSDPKKLQKALKVAAKIDAFPRKMSASELDKITASATETDKVQAYRKVRLMCNRLWLIKLGGFTLIILGLILLLSPISFFTALCTLFTGVGIIAGSTFFGWKTGVFEAHHILKKHKGV